MSEFESTLELTLVEPKHHSLWRRLLRPKDIGFYLMILLSWVGIIYSTSSLEGSRWYWHWLIPGFGVICIFTRWNKTEKTFKARALLVLHEILYWGGVLGLTSLIYAVSSPANSWIDLFDIRQLSFLVAFILATSTYLAGLNRDWRLCVVAAFILTGGLANVAFSNMAPTLIWGSFAVIVTYIVWAWLHSIWRSRKTLPTDEI
ncbi:MAG: hypothetical protein KDJ28_09305 [Candidatus Competibacteraceae bacterium]|nr:hypothetical protein [Candidatus Competibacteraceae bacterium]